MSKRETTLPERLALLKERFGGSRRALSRFLGITDTGLAYWEKGVPPRPKLLRKVSDKSGLSFEWLSEGKGDTEKELAKCREVTVQDAVDSRLAEQSPTISEGVAIVLAHGDPADMEVVEAVLNATVQRIRKRQAGGGPRKSVKY